MLTASALAAARADLEGLSISAAEKYSTDILDCLNDVSGTQNPIYFRSVTGFGLAGVIEDGVLASEDDMAKLPQLTLTAKQRAIKYGWTFLGQRTDQYGLVEKSARDAGKKLKATMERDATNLVLNNAFSSSYPIATASALYADAHSINGGTFDNLYTATALSESAVSGMLTQLRKQQDSRNIVMPFQGKVKLIVPPDLLLTAQKIAASTQVPGTADNDKNVVAAYIQVVEAPFATSATAYAMLPQDKTDHYMQFYPLVQPVTGMEKVAEGHVKFVHQAAYDMGVELPYSTIGCQGA